MIRLRYAKHRDDKTLCLGSPKPFVSADELSWRVLSGPHRQSEYVPLVWHMLSYRTLPSSDRSFLDPRSSSISWNRRPVSTTILCAADMTGTGTNGRGQEILGVFALFEVLCTIVCALRVYTRLKIQNAFGLDDWFAVLAWVSGQDRHR
jgi:hypothetical protein